MQYALDGLRKIFPGYQPSLSLQKKKADKSYIKVLWNRSKVNSVLISDVNVKCTRNLFVGIRETLLSDHLFQKQSLHKIIWEFNVFFVQIPRLIEKLQLIFIYVY